MTRRINRTSFLMITDTALAISDSICEALIIDLFDYWSTTRQQEWLFVTFKQLTEELYYFFAINTIKRSIKSLEDKNIIISEKLEGNSKKYRLNYDLINNWSNQNDHII